MSEENVASLLFAGELERSSGAKPTPAIDVLQRLHECGKFSPNSCVNLHTMLAEINRHDLAQLVNQYMDTYPAPPVTSAGVDDDGAGYDSQMTPYTSDELISSVISQDRLGSAFSGSHITLTHTLSEDDDAEDCRAYVRPECKSMTGDVLRFHSACSLSIGSQTHGSQVMLEPGAEGLHSTIASPPSIRIDISNIHSTEPLTESNDSLPLSSPPIPAHIIHRTTSLRWGPRSAMRSSLHTPEATISEERPEEKREACQSSPDASSARSTPTSPMPEIKSPFPFTSGRVHLVTQ